MKKKSPALYWLFTVVLFIAAAFNVYGIIRESKSFGYPSVIATVTDIVVDTTYSGDTETTNYTATLAYTYEGTDRTTVFSVDGKTAVGDTLNVRVNPENPLDLYNSGVGTLIRLGIIGGISLVLGIAFLANGLRKRIADKGETETDAEQKKPSLIFK